MLCPKCQKSETKVIDSRPERKSVWRRRICPFCQHRFTTYERIEIPKLLVVKKDGRREAYLREKMIIGIQKACEKRPIKTDKIEEIVDKIEQGICRKGKKEIETKTIGKMVMDELKRLDPVAYIRFASVYRAFRGPKSFDKEIHRLLK